MREAARFRERVAQLRASGLGNQVAFQLLQTYSAGCVTHLLRANFEEGPWLQRLDDTWLAIVQDIVGDPLPQDRRKQLFIRLADGGLGLTSAMETAPLAFLASWAFVLPEVAATVGTVSWASFSQQCHTVGDSVRKAEERMAQLGGGSTHSARLGLLFV